MTAPGYNVDTQELREAADWVNHQRSPAPDWDGLLIAAAQEIDSLREQNDRVVTENSRLIELRSLVRRALEVGDIGKSGPRSGRP